MNLNRIFANLSDNAITRNHQKAALEMNNYLKISNCWDVSDNAMPYVSQLQEVKEMVHNFAKHNNVFVDMFVPSDKDLLKLSVVKLNKKGVPDFSNECIKNIPLSNEPVEMHKTSQVMLENKDGLNYVAKSIWTTEDNFIRQVYRAIGELTNNLKSNG